MGYNVSIMSLSLAEPLLTLLAIMAIGWRLGQQPVRRISPGSAGVLLVAPVFGHFGMKVPKEVMDPGSCSSSRPSACRPVRGSSAPSGVRASSSFSWAC